MSNPAKLYSLSDTIIAYNRFDKNPNIPEDVNDPRRQDFEYPELPDHYRNRVAEAAPIFLQRWIHNIKQFYRMPFWESENDHEGHLLEPPQDFDFTKGIVKEDLEMPSVDDMNEDTIVWECEVKRVSHHELVVLIL